MDTTLSVWIPDLSLSFKGAIQNTSRLLTMKNHSHTVIKAEYFPTEYILGSILHVNYKFYDVIYKRS